jgi:PKD repeat protein
MSATPDTIVADGESQSVIHIRTRDANGDPVAGVRLQLDAVTSELISGATLTESSVVTDGSGLATVGLVAPSAPATQFSQDPIVTIWAHPVAVDFANAAARMVQVRVVAPHGTQPGNRHPVAVAVANPPVANYNDTIHFDGSLSTDEGLACNGTCEYIWEFGDQTVAVRGMNVEHKFTLPGTYNVTLTVLDGKGGVGTSAVSVRIIGPAAPVPSFTFSPASPVTNGTTVTFDASSTTVGVGGSISQYEWNFGGTVVTSSSATTQRTFTTNGTYAVTLTVIDNLGRRVGPTAPQSITVQ